MAQETPSAAVKAGDLVLCIYSNQACQAGVAHTPENRGMWITWHAGVSELVFPRRLLAGNKRKVWLYDWP